MARRVWTVTVTAPKCDVCEFEGERRTGDVDTFVLRNVARNAGWYVRSKDEGDVFFICPTCRKAIGGVL